MSEKTFGRGQVEWAVWRSFARTRFDKSEVPQVFRTRIKRLLEIDRELTFSEVEVKPEVAYAFAPPPSAESGEVAYTTVDAFCLAVALDLLDGGFKQADVVFLMRYLRPDLGKRLPNILASPSVIDRQRRLAKTYPDWPSYEHKGQRYVDARLFVILQIIELTEILPTHTRKRFRGPVILEPTYCAGVTELGEELHKRMPNQGRTGTILEIASTAQAVAAFLQEAPEIRRGRPKA